MKKKETGFLKFYLYTYRYGKFLKNTFLIKTIDRKNQFLPYLLKK